MLSYSRGVGGLYVSGEVIFFIANEARSSGDSSGKSKAAQSTVTKLLLVEGFFYGVTIALFDAASVVAMFLSTLGASTWLIGLASTVRQAGLHLPQVFVASWFQGRLSGLLVRFVSFQWSATLFVVLAPLVAHFLGPGIALVFFAVGWLCFSFGDGASFVPWSDTMAATIGRRCGKFLGAYGVAESSGTMFAGVMLHLFIRMGVLDRSLGYVFVFGLGSLGLLMTVPVLRRVEQHGNKALSKAYRRSSRADQNAKHGVGEVTDGEPVPSSTIANVIHNSSRRLKLFFGARLLSMGIHLVAPFILLYGLNEIGLSDKVAGLLVWAEMAGISLGSMLAGRLASRFGSRAVVKLSCFASAASPLFALSSIAVPAGFCGWSPISVMISMLCVGAFQSSSWVGCTGYVVERAQEKDRPMIIGMLNLLALPFLCLSPVGGLIIKHVGYVPVFVVATVLGSGSAMLALRID